MLQNDDGTYSYSAGWYGYTPISRNADGTFNWAATDGAYQEGGGGGGAGGGGAGGGWTFPEGSQGANGEYGWFNPPDGRDVPQGAYANEDGSYSWAQNWNGYTPESRNGDGTWNWNAQGLYNNLHEYLFEQPEISILLMR